MTIIKSGRLPGGRVQRKGGADAQLVQGESNFTRQLAAEDEFDEVLSVADQRFCVFEGTASSVVTSQRTVFLPITKLMHDCRLDYATFVVNTASVATDVAELALYMLDQTKREVLRQVAPSKVSFHFGTAGVLSIALRAPLALEKGTLIVAGFWNRLVGAPAYPVYVSTSAVPPTMQIATASLMYLPNDSGLQPEYRTDTLTGVDTRQPFPLFGYASETFAAPTQTW